MKGLRVAYAGDPRARAMGAGRDLFACRKDGGEIPVEVALSPMSSEDGLRVLVSVVDITQRKRVDREAARQRDELAHLSRVAMLGELSGSLAHELNQPLTAILSNAQAAQRFLAHSPPRIDKLAEILTDIVKSDHRAEAVIQRLRSLLRKEESRRYPLDINEVVEGAPIRLVRSDLLSRQVVVSTDLAEALPAVSGDRNQLQQVLLNFVINGCDAMDDQEVDRRLLVRTLSDRPGQCRSLRCRPGRGNTFGEPRTHFRAVRDHQGDRHGFGSGHLQVDRRGTWRPAVGNQQCGLRCDAALRIAGQGGLASMREQAPTVYVVDDDPDVLKAIERLLESIGLNVAMFLSPHQFLETYQRNAPGCLVLDLALPGLNGLDVQRVLEQRASVLPIVFLTGRGDIAASVQAMKQGAADFLTKPIDDTALIAAIHDALARDQVLRTAHLERERIAKCLAMLTGRERQVLELIVAGRLNKQIAAELGTTEKTIKFHRGNLMRKMGVRVVADLVKLAERAGVGSTPRAALRSRPLPRAIALM